MKRTASRSVVACGLGLLTAACAVAAPTDVGPPPAEVAHQGPEERTGPPAVVTLAFAGDVHFQLRAAALLDDPRGLGGMTGALAGADVAMVNLESAVTERGTPDPKELEVPVDRYWFRTPATALDFLADAGVDVVSVANNHGVDYGPDGL